MKRFFSIVFSVPSSVCIFALFAVSLMATPAYSASVTYDIAMGGQTTTFTAPMGGGAVSDFSITLAGVTYDTPDAGSPALYDPVDNDISAAGSQFGYFSNSIAAPGCPVGDCVLEFENRADPLIPPVYAAYNTVNLGTVFTGGFYEITVAPVPLPAGLVLLLTALLAVFGLRFKGRGQTGGLKAA